MADDVVADLVADFEEFSAGGQVFAPDGPLHWAGYGTARSEAAARSGSAESVICGTGSLRGIRVVLIVFDFRFLGGSVGSAAGARITHAFTQARAHALPVVSLIATGGTRMQEGMVSLHQLQLITREAIRRTTPHIAVLRDPTTGGLWASLGAGADVVLAERGAQIGFAGRRVRSADDPAYTAEGQFAAGQVDELIDDLADPLSDWLRLLSHPSDEPADVPRGLGDPAPAADGWTTVRHTRATGRPGAVAYLDDYFTTRREICGDRAGGVDAGMLCGVGERHGRSIAYAAQTGTPTTPAGYRTASRLIRLADRLGLPVLTLVDTPGAEAGPAAERAGVASAIAELFATIAAARVPVTTLVIGEGGSGGALALCSPDRLWIAPDAYFSVIAPELAAAILKIGPADVPALADRLRLRPHDLLELGVVHGIASREHVIHRP